MSAPASGVVARAVRVAGVPTLVAAPSPRPDAVNAAHAAPALDHTDPGVPVVLWCHGFRADALSNAAELERCARAGFLAVGIDAVGHGARRDHTIADRMRDMGGALPVMLDFAERTVQELPGLIDALVRDHGADRTRVSLVGVSMGAFLGYRAVTDGVALRSLVALLGSPEWPGASSAHLHPEAFRHLPLLSITAEHDTSVPPEAVQRLHSQLDARYGTSPRRAYYQLRGAGHLTSAHEWDEAMAHTMAWLERHGRGSYGPTPSAEPQP